MHVLVNVHIHSGWGSVIGVAICERLDSLAD